MKNASVILADGYSVEIDDYNYTLIHNKVTKKGDNIGNTYKEVIGYFPDMESAVKRFLKEDVREQLDGMNNMTVADYFEHHKEIVESAVKEITKAVGK